MTNKPDYPRDLRGYGNNPPQACWPGGARVAVQFVLNYEEGGESSVLHGDLASEAFLSEIIEAKTNVSIDEEKFFAPRFPIYPTKISEIYKLQED